MPKSKHRKKQKAKAAHNRRQKKDQAHSAKLKQQKVFEQLQAKYQKQYEESIHRELQSRELARDINSDEVKEVAEKEVVHIGSMDGGDSFFEGVKTE